MNPYKARNSYEMIAAELDTEVDNVKIINNFYWKTIRVQLSSLTYPVINLVGLGHMKIKSWKVDPKIQELTNKKNKWETINTGSPIFENYANDLEKVLKVKLTMEAEKKREQAIKTLRLNYGV